MFDPKTGVLDLPVAKVFEPLLKPSRYKGAWGGRGSGKSHFFADLMVWQHAATPGMRSVCVREVLKSLKESAKLLIEDKIKAHGVGHLFEVQNDRILSQGGGFIVFQGMQDHNAESIKSFEGFDRCWIEEAQTLTDRSLMLLRPTIRQTPRMLGPPEIWASWNPRRKSDAIDQFLRSDPPDNAIVVCANHRDNPWFPPDMETERRLDLRRFPERYDHVWEGDYAKAFEGAYFAGLLNQARAEGRIGIVSADPILPIRAFWDIGGAGAKADATSIWIVQWAAGQIRVLDYIEGQGQVLGYYIEELRQRKFRGECVLPHDGLNANNVTGKRYIDHLRDAEFDAYSIPNQGAGAAMQRVEAVRRIMHLCLFNDEKTEKGRDALGFYHERRDANRNAGLGPEHDWSSHAADAFGLMAVCYEGSDVAPSVDYIFGRQRQMEIDTRSEITGY